MSKAGSKSCGGTFDTPAREARLAELTRLTETSGFWNNTDKANSILKEKAAIERSLKDWNSLATRLSDFEAMAELASEEGGESMRAELEQGIASILKDIAAAEIAALLSGEQDASNAIVSIHPGAGGTEAQDWAEMLMRMYLRWAEKRGYKTEILDYQSGEEAGVKSVMFMASGDYAYGRMKAETGVHRLVRISPFDANKRRHTSFASVYVYPEITEDIDISIDEKDLREALASFDPVWDELFPAEKARMIRLLIERVAYHAKDGEIEITFRPGGVKAMAGEGKETA